MERSRSLLPTMPRQFRQRLSLPWRTLSQMDDEMQKWFDEASLLPSAAYEGIDFAPQCDLKETKKEFIASFDVPGVKKSDLKIEVDGNRLTVRGERKQSHEEKEERRYFSEASYGAFMRSFTLPSNIDEGKVDAKYNDGVLTVTIPKAEVSKSREIAIH